MTVADKKRFRVPGIGSGSKGFAGLRVLTLESRNSAQMAFLVGNEGGIVVSAPSMREVPLTENPAALALAEDVLAGKVDLIIFLTGVGTRILFDAVATKHPRQRFAEAVSRLPVVARGPKVVSALRQLGVPIALSVPEPNTWRDIVKALGEHPELGMLKGKRIAIQEYGASNPDLTRALETQGVSVTPVQVYRWALPEDIEPLKRAIHEIVEGKIKVVLVTSATQSHHLMQVAAESGLEDAVRRGLERAVIGSVGPICSEALREHGIAVDFEPAHPKMGSLVHETAGIAKALLDQKRAKADHAR